MSKKKVMDDLDALLADLQSTTNHIQSYQERQEREREAESREGTPPPLPPHPTLDVIDSMYDSAQPIYEQTNVKPQYSTTTVVTKVTNNNTSYPTNNGLDSRQTPLSHNLSELDSLLEDLSSAQFMAEVDRRHSGIQAGSEQYVQSAQKVSPPRDRTVDSLLNDLETLPPPRYAEVQDYDTVNPGPNNAYWGEMNRVNAGQAYAHRGPSSHSPGLNNDGNHGNKPASTATRELDDLMASLSEFKMSPASRQQNPYPVDSLPYRQTPPQAGEPPYAQPHKMSPVREHSLQATHGVSAAASQGSSNGSEGSSLDKMLGNLNTDMTRQGVMIVPKGNCAACNNPIVNQVITALGRIWHPEHFTCKRCEGELGTRNFFERDGEPYCERDYQLLFSPRCAACERPILDQCMTAMDQTYHPQCFRCAHCQEAFGEEGFHEKDGKAYCRADYFDMFAPKCGGCNRAITDNYISALSKQWHDRCFVCRECGMPFGASSFFEHEGFPYCETHYHARRGSLCAGCQKPITGRCITAMYKKYHPEHFICAFCLKQLNKGTFKEQNNKPYCHPCFSKLFS